MIGICGRQPKEDSRGRGSRKTKNNGKAEQCNPPTVIRAAYPGLQSSALPSSCQGNSAPAKIKPLNSRNFRSSRMPENVKWLPPGTPPPPIIGNALQVKTNNLTQYLVMLCYLHRSSSPVSTLSKRKAKHQPQVPSHPWFPKKYATGPMCSLLSSPRYKKKAQQNL